jgi:hypothetical protein
LIVCPIFESDGCLSRIIEDLGLYIKTTLDGAKISMERGGVWKEIRIQNLPNMSRWW